jgi:hypothetical protein
VTNTLPVGKHRFSLIVTDGSGNQSLPAQVVVEVVESTGRPSVRPGPFQPNPFGTTPKPFPEKKQKPLKRTSKPLRQRPKR